ncbi:hypothetical protein BKA61DRAFT_578190 [Leptodontidium sp. MPI-SDFR-AT-0119]|nr:hypothetical protein BKA61DRAFT_578190 [Leptodontidium sp. MPI-SDFR-AT-0119]
MCLAEGCPRPTPQTPPSVPSGVKRARRYEGTKRQALSSVVPPCFRYFLSSKSSENDVREGDDACPTCCNLDLAVLLQRKIFGPENAGPVHMPVDPAVLELSSKTCEPCSVIWEGISVHLARLDYRMPEIPNSASLIIDQWGGLTAEVRVLYRAAKYGSLSAPLQEHASNVDHPDDTPAWSAFGLGSNVPQKLNITVCVENFRVQLKTCLTDHPHCQLAESGYAPGRFLDLKFFEPG